MRIRVAAGLLCMSCLVLAEGCGFSLRSWDLGGNVESFYVEARGNNPLELPLQRALRQAGVPEADSPSAAAVVVQLRELRRSRRGVSVTSRARVAEYELNVDVLFAVRSANKQLLAPQWARSSRVYRVDRDNLVGSDEEQSLLEREMHGDLVQQIIRAVNAVTTEPVDAS